MFRRVISLLLALVLLVGTVPPVQVRAEETVEETVAETVMETVTETTEGTTAPVETLEPAETVPETETPEESIPEETQEPVSADAANTLVDSGSCGDDVTWELDSNGRLTISGTGPMEDYETVYLPWYHYKEQITSAVIESGVTSIGKDAFFTCTELVSVTIPDTVVQIGDRAFYVCSSLTSVTLPNALTRIGKMPLNAVRR